jgi:hypothetical protein
MEAELDLRRLAELEELLGTELPQIVGTLVSELTTAFEEIAAGLRSPDLEAVAAAAHAARNSALMIDAQPLLKRLSELEASARAGDLSGAKAAHAQLQQIWPRVRHKLTQAAGGRD